MNCTDFLLQDCEFMRVNKPYITLVQVLLKTTILLESRRLFIDSRVVKYSQTFDRSESQLLFRSALILLKVRHIAVLFLGFSNKNKSPFLIHRILSIKRTSSYSSPSSKRKNSTL